MLLLKLCKAIDIFLKFGKFNKYFALLLLRGHMLQFTKKPFYHMTSRLWNDIMPCIKIDKPLVVYRFSGNVIKCRP